MKKMDSDGLILCDIQASAFELSINRFNCSSEIYIRRFANSSIATYFDNKTLLNESFSEYTVNDLLEEEYGKLDYGKNKYTKNEMYWIGYIYRYFCYTYNVCMKKAYRLIKPSELRGVYLPYHTLDSAQAIERILEAKCITFDPDELTRRGVILLRKLRSNNKKSL
jgi:hypothetical protein